MLTIYSRLISIPLCLVLGLFTSLHANAAKNATEKQYEVEIIVFAQDMASNYGSENWTDKPGFPNIQNIAEHFTPAEWLLADDIERLSQYYLQPEYDPENENTLNKYAKRINTSSKYQLLIHRSWRQTIKGQKIYLSDSPDTDPIIDEEFSSNPQSNANLNGDTTAVSSLSDQQSMPVSDEEMLLQALLEEEKNFSEPLTQLPFFISELDEIQPFDEVNGIPESKNTALSYEGPPQYLIYGNFKLSKGRYLHIDLDFLYRGEPFIPEEKTLTLEEQFPMNEGGDTLKQLNTNEQSLSQNQNMPDVFAADQQTLSDEFLISEEVLEELSGFIPKEKPPLVGFRIKDSKRVRLNRIYYTDHPLFGVLYRIIRYEPPPPEEISTDGEIKPDANS